MGEFLGVLRVKVIRGTNLAIRDLLTSDPYVVLTLGQQVSYFLVHESLIYLEEYINHLCSSPLFHVIHSLLKRRNPNAN